MNITGIPQVLRNEALWCLWKYEERDGKRTKVPYNPATGGRAQSNNQNTFTSFQAALGRYEAGGYDGGGIGVFNGFGAVDIDHCIDENGEISPMALDIISTMLTYTERSPSGHGIRLIFKAPGFAYDKKRYYINNPSCGLEVYIAGCTQKFVTVTGDLIEPFPVEDRSKEIAEVLEKYMVRPTAKKQEQPRVQSLGDTQLSDGAIIKKAQAAKNGPAFTELWKGSTTAYPSHSEADLALCQMLAFWTNRDAMQMDRLFRQSGLMREKWDRQQSGSTYGAITIQEAISKCEAVYDPNSPEAREKRRNQAVAAFTEAVDQEGVIRINPIETPESRKRYTFNDRGNGYLFADSYKNLCRYCPEAKEWYHFNGQAWRCDQGSVATREFAKKLSIYLFDFISGIEDDELRERFKGNATQLSSIGKRDAMLKDAQSVYPFKLNQLDADPNLFNCRNGTLRLDTLEFRSQRPGDGLSLIAGVNFDATARCDLWTRTIEEITEGDRGKMSFLQRAFGYTLRGEPTEDCLFIFYGATTRNGKGTIMYPIMRILGDYAKTVSADTLAAKRFANGSGPSEDLARLRGARLVNINEPSKSMRFDAALVKALTGRDRVIARFLHQNSFEFDPQFSIYISTNHRPAIDDDTLFSSDRIKLVPFERHFEENEQDKRLKDRLAKPEALSGIFNWMLEGLAMYRKEGLGAPLSVKTATEQYRYESDKISQFMDEYTTPRIGFSERTSVLYARYQDWCKGNGQFPESMRKFSDGLKARGYKVEQRRWMGSEKVSHTVDVTFSDPKDRAIFGTHSM